MITKINLTTFSLKRILILLLPIIFLSCNKKVAIYCSSPDFTSFCFEFEGKKNFIYSITSCTYANRGSGNYKIIGDTIKFNFEETKLKKTGKVKISKTSRNDSSFVVNLTVIDMKTKYPIIGYAAKIIENDVLITGKSGDFTGKSILYQTYNNTPVKIEISSLGFAPIFFNMNKPGEYSIKVEMESGFLTGYISNTEEIYELVKMNKDSLVLRYFEEEHEVIILTRKK